MKRITVGIASPGDVTDIRDVVPKIFTRWNDSHNRAMLHPKMWEFAVPQMGGHPQSILNKTIIEASDLLVAIFWSKLGTPTPTAPSGTVEEIREFIRLKGPQRAMIYFCTRPLPYDINPVELSRLREFQAEMREQALYSQFDTVDQFEANLYHHLEVRAEEILTNEVILPPQSFANEENKQIGVSTDPQLSSLIDFGSTLDAITTNFKARMDTFQRIDGTGKGSNKYYRLGSHVYSSAASCLDRVIATPTVGISHHEVAVLERIAFRLKRLANQIPDVKADFREYWNDGSAIADDLVTQTNHIQRNTKKN
jgi:hypothetical protein